MFDYSPLLQPDLGQPARTIQIIEKAAFDDWKAAQPASVRSLAEANRFSAAAGEVLILPDGSGGEWSVVAGAAKDTGPWELAGLCVQLPEGTYRVLGGNTLPGALGWLLAHYRFARYRKDGEPVPARVLLTSDAADIAETVRLAEATTLVRDLVNVPASDLGPDALEHEVERQARTFGASLTVTRGDALESGFPLVHAVGRAADRSHAPRMIELEWGEPDAPRLAIIGKGVIFDSGGLNIKPASGMRQMKKDMGGAAHALALARLIMGAGLPVRLHLLIPAVENAISGNAMRPGDIVRSRKGLSVEIDNTDAEGRLILADALTRAAECEPDFMLDFATLTGAARVALGPDLPALFANDHELGHAFQGAALAQHDPVWQLPLWSGYDDMLKSDIADMVNSGEGGMAGAVTAALFLRRFVPDGMAWMHLDTFAWRNAAKPGRPKGGEALGLRAAWAFLKSRYRS
ncbi:MAG: leucyl aminopeptidase family protein [Sphingomonadales bacterium]|nr:leucyl aminopeptidase family protein [Sphingomonadales bacterium]